MSEKDPFFIVQKDVVESLDKASRLCGQLARAPAGSEEEGRLRQEARNTVRSIEWDLEDLNETIGVVDKNPGKFKMTHAELEKRKNSLKQLAAEAKELKEFCNQTGPTGALKGPTGALKGSKKEESKKLLAPSTTSQRLTYSSETGKQNGGDSTGDFSHPNRSFLEEEQARQQLLIAAQDDEVENIGASVKVLKNIGRSIGDELEEHAGLLDEFGHEMENTDSKLDGNLKKIGQVLHMSSDKRQCAVIVVLAIILVVIIILLIAL